jgi:hypothetical protein
MVKLQFTFKTMSFKFINSPNTPKYIFTPREVINNRPNTSRAFLLKHRRVIAAQYKEESLLELKRECWKPITIRRTIIISTPNTLWTDERACSLSKVYKWLALPVIERPLYSKPWWYPNIFGRSSRARASYTNDARGAYEACLRETSRSAISISLWSCA